MFLRMHVCVCMFSMLEFFAEIKYVKSEDRYKLTFFFVWQHEILALLCKTYRSSDEIFSDAIEYLPIFLQAVFIDFFSLDYNRWLKLESLQEAAGQPAG